LLSSGLRSLVLRVRSSWDAELPFWLLSGKNSMNLQNLFDDIVGILAISGQREQVSMQKTAVSLTLWH
jgi:hypothetical protein